MFGKQSLVVGETLKNQGRDKGPEDALDIKIFSLTQDLFLSHLWTIEILQSDTLVMSFSLGRVRGEGEGFGTERGKYNCKPLSLYCFSKTTKANKVTYPVSYPCRVDFVSRGPANTPPADPCANTLLFFFSSPSSYSPLFWLITGALSEPWHFYHALLGRRVAVTFIFLSVILQAWVKMG